MELQVLRAAADGVADLLRIGGGEHEHDMRRRLLQRLQQRRLGRLRQHVHLVEDVHLVPAGRAERRLLDEVAHRVDTVVARRVELVHVVAGATLDREARLALAARLAVDRRSQLSTLARMRAEVVLPVPRGPENRYAWPSRWLMTALRRARTTCSWPRTSLKRRGRYRR